MMMMMTMTITTMIARNPHFDSFEGTHYLPVNKKRNHTETVMMVLAAVVVVVAVVPFRNVVRHGRPDDVDTACTNYSSIAQIRIDQS